MELLLQSGIPPLALFVDGTKHKIFYSDANSLGCSNLDGTNAITLALTTGTILDFELDTLNNELYIAAFIEQSYRLFRVNGNIDDYPSPVFLSNLNPIIEPIALGAIALDLMKGWIYIKGSRTSNNDVIIQRCRLNGSSLEEVAILDGFHGTQSFAISPKHQTLYWNEDNVLNKMSITTGPLSIQEILIPVITSIPDIFIDNETNEIYWSTSPLLEIQKSDLFFQNIQNVITDVPDIGALAIAIPTGNQIHSVPTLSTYNLLFLITSLIIMVIWIKHKL